VIRTLDVAIVIGYLAALSGIGAVFARRQRSLDTFLVAGRRMPWLAVGVSLMAALNSGIDYLTQPSATIQYGLVLVMGVVSWLVLYPWVGIIVFPFYHRLSFYSVYEYLESRFDVRVRTLAAAIFVAWRLGWMATALYVPCLAVDAVSGGTINLTLMIVVLGALVTLYTMMGGIQAVIWNDVIQFCVMFGGLGATVWIVASATPGGVPAVWAAADAAGKTHTWVTLGSDSASGLLGQIEAFFRQPMTLPGLLSALVVGRMAQYTSDQVMVLRLMTTKTVEETRHAFIVNAAGDTLWTAGLAFVGLALFSYFQLHPPPAGLPADRMLPYFMSQAFPPGAVGLVIAAILAASLSSIDSAVHSCSSVLMVDVYNRLIVGRGGRRGDSHATGTDDRSQIFALRVMTAIVGIAGTALACNVQGIGGLLEIWNKLINSFTGPLFGIFLLAMFSRRATSAAALVGGATGAIAAYVVAYHSAIGFLWPSTFGLAATLGAGGAVTLLAPGPSSGEQLTWRAVMRRSTAARVAQPQMR
jgi:solute:Na+ symporter, SSS family